MLESELDTELRNHSELLRHLKQAYCLIDANGRILFANSRALKDYLSSSLLPINSVYDLISESSGPSFQRCLERQSQAANGDDLDEEPEWFKTRMRDVQPAYVEMALSSLPCCAGYVLAIRETSFSIIEHKRVDSLRADIGKSLIQDQGLKSILKSCTDAMVRHLDAALARVYIYDESSKLLVMQASSGPEENSNSDFYRIPIGKWKVGRSGLERKAHWCHDLQNDPEVVDKDWVRSRGIITFGAVPLMSGKRLVGVLAISSKNEVSDELVCELSSLCDYLAVLVESKAKDRLENQLSTLVQASQEAITIRGMDGKITYWNKAAEEIYGYSEADAIGMDFLKLVPAELEAEQLALMGIIERGELAGLIESVRLSKNGARIPVSITCFPIFDGFGEIFAFCSITRDLRDKKLREAQAAQILLLQEREDYLYTLTHELKGPLLGVRRICDQLLKSEFGTIPVEPALVLSKIQQNNEELLALIQNIIDVFRYERQSSAFEFLKSELKALLFQSISNLSTYANSKQVKIDFESPLDSVEVMVDQRALRRVIENLLENAVKFSALDSTVKVRLSVSAGSVILDFENYGEPLSKLEQERLFERFWQGVRGKAYASGSGLGLYLCRKIIEAHWGTISYQPLGNSGNVFRVRLPVFADRVS